MDFSPFDDPTDYSVPAKLEPAVNDFWEGTFGFDGTLIFDGESLSYRYRKSRVMGGKSSPESWEIGVGDLRAIALKTFSVVVAPKRMHKLDDLPGHHASRVKFRIKYGDRPSARALVDAINERLSEDQEVEFAGVPFRMADLGAKDVWGVLYVEPDLLVVDVSIGMPGVTARNSHVVKLGPGAIASVTHTKRAIGRDRLVVRVVDERKIEHLPFAQHDTLTLKVSRRHREELESIVRIVGIRMARP